MPELAFGQPDGAIIQFAYNVADLDQAMSDFSRTLRAGPWFVIGPFSPPAARYLGQPCRFEITIALGFAGHVQIELLQQHNDAPSMLRDRPLGFHHWGIGARDFEAELGRHTRAGLPVVFTDTTPDGGRVAYLDPSAAMPAMPGMIEVIEMTPGLEQRFASMCAAADGWDGTDPIRRM